VSTHVRPLAFALALAGGCYTGVGTHASGGADAGDEEDGGDAADDDDAGDGTAGDDGPGAIACDPDAPWSASPLRRLTRRQYENTLFDLVATVVGPDDARAILDGLAVKLAAVPVDDRTDYVRLDQALDQEHVDGWYRVGKGIGDALTADPARLEALAGPCATDGDASNDDACVRDFVAQFGRLAFRRPLGADEIAFHAADATGSATDVSAAAFTERVAIMLMVPDFIYVIEDDLPEDGTDTFPLSGLEIASRLSFHFWDSMPDDALLQAAEDGRLDDDEGYTAEVDRVFADPRTRRTLGAFTNEWLQLERLPPLDELLGSPAYDAFVGDTTPSPALRGDMIAEVEDLFLRFGVDEDGTLADLFLSTESTTTSAELAAIYGVAPRDANDPPLVLPESERGGLLTRAALVATGSLVTHPVLKGKLVRTRILCDDIPPPPADVPPPPQLDPESTIREQLEQLTQREGTACKGCHDQLNPLGFVTENYDGLGRHRTEERVFDLVTGELLATQPVDTAAVARVAPGDERIAADGMQLAEYVLDSGRAEDCLARQYFRFAFGRIEDDDADGCALAALRDAVGEGGSLRAMLRDVALRPEFRVRRRESEDE
jgi:hypothetical protein